MSGWLQLKRREHPRSFLSGREKALPPGPARKSPARRARSAARGQRRTR